MQPTSPPRPRVGAGFRSRLTDAGVTGTDGPDRPPSRGESIGHIGHLFDLDETDDLDAVCSTRPQSISTVIFPASDVVDLMEIGRFASSRSPVRDRYAPFETTRPSALAGGRVSFQRAWFPRALTAPRRIGSCPMRRLSISFATQCVLVM
ncbi:MAG: hypothetical protein CMJ23_03125 [Phycisphaerae bacterium]|nr:hypothetical protein [Phycisphaerae bacterium]